MIALADVLCLWLWYEGVMSLGSLGYLLVGLGVLYLFVAMLGVHAGITYANSRSALPPAWAPCSSCSWAWPPACG